MRRYLVLTIAFATCRPIGERLDAPPLDATTQLLRRGAGVRADEQASADGDHDYEEERRELKTAETLSPDQT